MSRVGSMRTEEDDDLLEYLGGYGGALVGGERRRASHIRTTVGMSMYFGYGKRGTLICRSEYPANRGVIS